MIAKTSNLGYLLEYDLREKAGANGNFDFIGRIKLLNLVLILSFSVLVLRLAWLQLVEGERNRILSEENRILARKIQAPRGIIKDRNGKVLVQNSPIYRLHNKDCTQDREIGSSSCNEFSLISREEAMEIIAQANGKELQTLVGRDYIFTNKAAHVIGYVGEVSKDELGTHPDFSLGDLIGKTGIEMQYDNDLRGINGSELVEINANSNVVREVAKREAKPGKDIKLTLDIDLQEKAYELMQNRSGALVVIDPRNGEVLSLLSTPSFDPNKAYESLSSTEKPFFNRAIAGLYPPGSVFKIVTAIAGLQDGKIDKDSRFEDTGEIRIGAYTYGNWYFSQYGRTEGWLDIVHAIKRSNDIFFYKVGGLVGAQKLADWARNFGYGQISGVDLPGEAEGLVPSPLWKERIRGERWFLGNTYHFAIGQADLQVTPLQVAMVTSAIANEGRLCKPHFVLGNNKNDMQICRDLGIAKENITLVKEGMMEACRTGGTAFPFFNFGSKKNGNFQRIDVGCKTGTAEFGDPEKRTHAWFTVFAPAEKPEIAVTVLLEKAGEGSYVAAPIAKDLLSFYFNKIN